MNPHVSIPGWDDFLARLKEDLNYSETMLERTFYTYRSFVQKFCPANEDDAELRYDNSYQVNGKK